MRSHLHVSIVEAGVRAALVILLLMSASNAGVFPGASWQQSPPDSQGVDAAKLTAALNYLKGECGSHGITQVVVIRKGYIIWKGSDIDNQHNVWSSTKSFTSTVLGLLIEDGKCTLETKAKDHVSSLASKYPNVELKHFATMTSGYNNETGCQSTSPFTPSNPKFAPGTQFEYCDDAMNQFGNVLTHIAGEPIEALFKRRIADPIGMDRSKWDWKDWGSIDGTTVNGGAGNKSKGIHISPREFARFGWLFLNKGNWDGEQLIDSQWVIEATKVQVPESMSGEGGPGNYGYNWWSNSEGLRWPDVPTSAYLASGFNNNKCIVIPDWEMVIAREGTDGSIDQSVYNEFLKRVGDAIIPDVTQTARYAAEPARSRPSVSSTRTEKLRFDNIPSGGHVVIYSPQGARVGVTGNTWNAASAAAPGLYLYTVVRHDGAPLSRGTFMVP